MSNLPKGWEEVQLDSVLEKFQNGYAFSSEGYVDSGIPIISMANISLNGTFQYDYEKAKYWSSEELDNLKQYQLNKGDLLIAMTDVTPDKKLIGRMAIVDIDDTFLLNQRVGLLKLKDSVNSKFLCEYGNFTVWRKYSKNVAALGAQANISTKDIKNGRIPLPPLEEQKRIADILSTVDKKIAFVEENISATEELKKGLMQKLLTEGIGHKEFKDSELGRIPESWEIKEIQESTDYVDYRGKTPTKTKNGIFLVTARNIKNNKIDYSLSEEFVSIEDYDNVMSRGLPKIGDILLTTEAPLGEIAMVDREDIALAQRIIKYRGKENILDNGYLKYCFLSSYFQKLLDLNSTGSTVKGIKGSRLKKLNILIPPLEEQKQIAEILSTVDKKLENLKEKKQSFEELKKGLMQKLLTGEVRV
ncbi:restriction endonuclease subunit S [Aliarcobacter butzleri]|uniref:restriction endonuclease subunit S n=1 Tax=Aliarcobacter butzleri TaxID=28197 RepID=UPI002B240691|nr:restriction endonuclease subunit S [Aliarcobacter butzleri]